MRDDEVLGYLIRVAAAGHPESVKRYEEYEKEQERLRAEARKAQAQYDFYHRISGRWKNRADDMLLFIGADIMVYAAPGGRILSMNENVIKVADGDDISLRFASTPDQEFNKASVSENGKVLVLTNKHINSRDVYDRY